MRRLVFLLALLASCSDAADKPAEDPKADEPKLKADAYTGYHINRDGCVRFVGYFEPVVTLDETYIKYDWRFRGTADDKSAEPVLLYVDHAKSGYDMGVWRNKRVIAVGRLHESREVGHERTPGLDTKRPIVADVLELVSIDSDLNVGERLPSRVEPNREPEPEKKK
jgi:hypothetical protein